MKHMMIVVADSTRARIFTVDSARSPLNEIETMAHPEGRIHEQNLVSDLPGKDSGKGGGGDHAFQEKIEPKREEMIEFAKRIADYLDNTRKANNLNKLAIIAAPAFLGELRTHLSKETSEKIVFDLDKNLAHHSEEDIRSHLSQFLSQ
jgi:protein required for attachment to host cells